MIRYAVALGSNLGERLGHLQEAISALGEIGSVTAVSSLYETAPVGGPDQDPFLNAVVVLESDLEPHDLLTELHRIEAAASRERTVRWGPRTLDLDIVAFSGPPVATPDLVIPHPGAVERRFVLEPLSEIWPESDVGPGVSASRALESVADQDVDRLAGQWANPDKTRPGRYWVAVQIVWFAAIAIALVANGSLPTDAASAGLWIGALLAVLGGLLTFQSLRELGPSLTAVPEPLESGTLIATGPYAHARHPIYGGLVLFLTGASLLLDSLPAVLLSLGLGVFFWLKSGYEERQLRIAYPGYGSYTQEVGRRLIPFVL